MSVSRSMEEIWQIKDRIGRELEGRSNEEILAYFREREPEWAKSLPTLERTDPTRGDIETSVHKELG